MRLVDLDELLQRTRKLINTPEADVELGNEENVLIAENFILHCIESSPQISAIPIPNEATNGDVIQAMFPNVSITEIGGGATVAVANAYKFNISWWNAPYKRKWR